MRGYFVLILVLVPALGASGLQAATINVVVQTDHTTYICGEELSWTVYVWTEPDDNRGICELSLSLSTTPAISMSSAHIEYWHGMPEWVQLLDSEYGIPNYFGLLSAGTPDPKTGRLAEIHVAQHDIPDPAGRVLDVGQDDGLPPLLEFAEGNFSVYPIAGTNCTCGCAYTLSAEVDVAKYWPSATGDAMDFDEVITQDADFFGPAPIPEPMTPALVGTGLIALMRLRRKRK